MFREDQKTDEFIKIGIGSEDILNQLENVMENGTYYLNGTKNGLARLILLSVLA